MNSIRVSFFINLPSVECVLTLFENYCKSFDNIKKTHASLFEVKEKEKATGHTARCGLFCSKINILLKNRYFLYNICYNESKEILYVFNSV